MVQFCLQIQQSSAMIEVFQGPLCLLKEILGYNFTLEDYFLQLPSPLNFHTRPPRNVPSKQLRNKLSSLINNILNRVSAIPAEDGIKQGCPTYWRTSTTIIVSWFADSRYTNNNVFAKYPQLFLNFYKTYVIYITMIKKCCRGLINTNLRAVGCIHML
jgi:hypothetical protein